MSPKPHLAMRQNPTYMKLETARDLALDILPQGISEERVKYGTNAILAMASDVIYELALARCPGCKEKRPTVIIAGSMLHNWDGNIRSCNAQLERERIVSIVEERRKLNDGDHL